MSKCCIETEPVQNESGVAMGVAQDRRSVVSEFIIDSDGNPKGGWVHGEGFSIDWQNGVQMRSGAFIEEVLEAVMQRFQFFQGTKFACSENNEAITGIQLALNAMKRRLENRAARGVEGSYVP